MTQSACYSLKGTSIDPAIKTFFVQDIDLADLDAPADVNQRFAELLRSKIRNRTRLVYNENEPDIEYSGSILNYEIKPESASGNNTTPFSRLEITVKLKLVSNKENVSGWDANFTFFKVYDNTLDISSIQDNLINEILGQLTEDVFDKSFTDW